jgi:hypothetical protein
MSTGKATFKYQTATIQLRIAQATPENITKVLNAKLVQGSIDPSGIEV